MSVAESRVERESTAQSILQLRKCVKVGNEEQTRGEFDAVAQA